MTTSKWLAIPVFLFAFAAAPTSSPAQDQAKPSQEKAATDKQAEKPADKPAEKPAAPPAARPSDVSSPDAILAACYDVISGPAGQKRDWDRFRSLFFPGARLIPSGPKKEGGYFAQVVTPDQYAQFAEGYFEKNAFTESEIARKSERFGDVMHIFSTYASRHDAKDPEPFERGINSFQLFFDGTRWWILTIYWIGESADLKIPAEFLPPAH